MLLLLLLSEACLVITIIITTTHQVGILMYQSQCQRISNENWSHRSSESMRTRSEFPYLEPRRHGLLLLLITHCSWTYVLLVLVKPSAQQHSGRHCNCHTLAHGF